jgi:hypothetical protein
VKLHNEDLHNLYASPSIIRVNKSMRMRRARNVARMGRRGIHGKTRKKETARKTKTKVGG